MKRLYGNLSGLKPSQLKRIERITGRRVSPAVLISTELARDVARISSEIRRQIGLLINRKGKVACVIVGDHHQIFIPGIVAQRVAAGRLTGLRCVHTHLKLDPLSQEDLTDLVLLRLDMMATITMTPDGRPDQIYAAHILPGENEAQAYEVMPPIDPYHPDRFCLETILALEAEMAQQLALRESGGKGERALLISVTTSSRREALDSFHELEQLAVSAGIEIVDKILQQRTKVDPRILLGSGKLRDLAILAMQRDATMMVFDQELNPSQIKSITDQVELKVIDRTQLILDIFAQRAQTREGQLQVELAQLKYLLPRLISKNTAMSRLTGGIGGIWGTLIGVFMIRSANPANKTPPSAAGAATNAPTIIIMPKSTFNVDAINSTSSAFHAQPSGVISSKAVRFRPTAMDTSPYIVRCCVLKVVRSNPCTLGPGLASIPRATAIPIQSPPDSTKTQRKTGAALPPLIMARTSKSTLQCKVMMSDRRVMR